LLILELSYGIYLSFNTQVEVLLTTSEAVAAEGGDFVLRQIIISHLPQANNKAGTPANTRMGEDAGDQRMFQLCRTSATIPRGRSQALAVLHSPCGQVAAGFFLRLPVSEDCVFTEQRFICDFQSSSSKTWFSDCYNCKRNSKQTTAINSI